MYKLTATSGSIIRTTDDAGIPADPLNRDYQQYLAWIAEGNTPDPHIPPQPTQATLAAAVQGHLDATARAKGYDSALSCVTYINSTVPQYKAEATAMRDWRDAVWLRCYEVLAEVQAGTRPVPTEAELIALLPSFE
jgi:hypothetical protein